LAEKAEEIEALFERLEELAPERSDPSARDRSCGQEFNDGTQPPRRPRRTDEDLLHEIAAVLDEAAQRIERVK
jgi:hypothetical protein